MGLSGSLKVFDIKPSFQVEIDGFKSAEFSKVTGLEVEIEAVEHREGGSMVAHKQPGLVKFADIVLERGVAAGNTDFFDWVTTVVALSAAGAGATNVGLEVPLFERNLDIVQLSRDGGASRRWSIYGAWPKKYIAGEWGSDQNEVVIETLTLACRWWDLTKV